MAERVIGVIGGSGLYDLEGLRDIERVAVETPFGNPSDEYVVGRLDGKKVAFLPRHGRGHRICPGDLNSRANIYGFKALGARTLISLSAVGSMREEISPGDMVIVDQFIDRTRSRVSTFFGDGIAGHVQFADPVCGEVAQALHDATEEVGAAVHKGGTYLCIEGPQFSTRAESRLYRQWGVDVIGMTNLPEAKLAREAGICYATLAMATDYDCWYEGHDDVSVETVLETLRRNADTARRIIGAVIRRLSGASGCDCRGAGNRSVITDPEAMDPGTRDRLALILAE